MADTLTAEDMTVAGVAERLLAILQGAGLQTRQQYVSILVVTDPNAGHGEQIEIEVDCGSTWRTDASKHAMRVSVKPPWHRNNKFKRTNYAVENGKFNQTKILARVRAGLDYLAKVNELDKANQKKWRETDESQRLEFSNLQEAIKRTGVEIRRLDGDRARYEIKWYEIVDLEKLPALLKALDDSKSPS